MHDLLTLPNTIGDAWIAGFAHGIARDQHEYGVHLIGVLSSVGERLARLCPERDQLCQECRTETMAQPASPKVSAKSHLL
jgi:hypothetical protein